LTGHSPKLLFFERLISSVKGQQEEPAGAQRSLHFAENLRQVSLGDVANRIERDFRIEDLIAPLVSQNDQSGALS
jgi:hypothetical protein